MVRRSGFTGLLFAAGLCVAMVGQAKAQATFTIEVADAVTKPWVGISLEELSEVAKAQLGITDGVVIQDVVPDSPAAKAGIQKFDIVTKIGDQSVKAPEEVPEVLGKSKGELTFSVVRSGKPQVIKVTPTDRPNFALLNLTNANEAEQQAQNAQNAKKMLDRALKLYSTEKDGKPVQLDAIGPAIVLRAEAMSSNAIAKLPDDLKLVVTREGSKPATIKVSRGDKSWDITEDKIDDLPEDLRAVVRNSLSGGPRFDQNIQWANPGQFTIRWPEGNENGLKLGVPAPAVATPDGAMQRIEQQLKEMRKQLDDLKSKLKDAAN